jgi:hypothetical protein
MTKYGIQSLGNIDVAYCWKWDNLMDAKKNAESLARQYHVKFFVFEIIGSFEPTVEWKDGGD